MRVVPVLGLSAMLLLWAKRMGRWAIVALVATIIIDELLNF